MARHAAVAGVVIPLRAFHGGKARLASRLEPEGRTRFVRWMAERVVAAAADLPVAVVTDAADVRGWAERLGATVLDDPGSLDASASVGRDWARRAGLERLVVAHGDLPRARSFQSVLPAEPGGVVAVACHRGDGTPVLSVPTAAPFTFSYGAGSFARHRSEAERLDLPFVAVDDPSLAFDVDLPDDLDQLEAFLAEELRTVVPEAAHTRAS